MKKSIKFLLSCAVAGVFILTAASSSSLSSAIATYDIGLASVETPANAKAQFGETKVVPVSEEGKTKYRYEDDYIDIVWYVSGKQFNFTLKNKSNHTLKINWDDISYVDTNGRTGRVMHSGVKYNERNNSQPSSTVPKGATLSDLLLPTDNVSYSSPTKYTSGGWNENYLFPCIYKDEASLFQNAPDYIGKTMTILMPIMIENVQNDYTFTFNINELLTQPTKK